MSCLSCFCSVKLSGSLLPPVPLFDQTLRHIAYRAMSSMNHYGGIYWKLCFWKSVKKWKFKTFDGMKIHHMMHFHHIIYIKIFIKKWKCAWKSTICHILQIWLSLIIWNNYDFQDTSAHPPVWTLTGRQALWGATTLYTDEKSSYVGKSPCDGKSLLIFNIRKMMTMGYHHMMWSHH